MIMLNILKINDIFMTVKACHFLGFSNFLGIVVGLVIISFYLSIILEHILSILCHGEYTVAY